MNSHSGEPARDPASPDAHTLDNGRFQQDQAVHAAAAFLNSLADHFTSDHHGLSHDPTYDPAVLHDPGVSEPHLDGLQPGHDPGMSYDPHHDVSGSHDPGASFDPSHEVGANAQHAGGDMGDAAHNAGAHDAATSAHHP